MARTSLKNKISNFTDEQLTGLLEANLFIAALLESAKDSLENEHHRRAYNTAVAVQGAQFDPLMKDPRTKELAIKILTQFSENEPTNAKD